MRSIAKAIRAAVCRAMRQGLVESSAYLEQWRWGEIDERPGTPDEVLDALERELEAAAK